MNNSTNNGAYLHDRVAWLERRRLGIGASDVAGIVGLSPWASPWSVWVSKVMPGTSTDEQSEAMEFGLMAEPMLKAYFEKRTGLWVIGEQTFVTHPEHPWVIATLDGYVFESHSGCDDPTLALGVAEFKTTSEPPWDEVPDHYRCQAQWSMLTTGAERVYFGVLHAAFGRHTFRVYVLERDQADIDYLFDQCSRFWHDHVITGVPPQTDPTDATTDALATYWPHQTEGDTIEADLEHLSAIALYRAARTAVKDAEERLHAAENALKALIGEHEAITDLVDGKVKTVASWKAQDRTTIDSKALRDALPDVADLYSKTTSTRVLRVN